MVSLGNGEEDESRAPHAQPASATAEESRAVVAGKGAADGIGGASVL
jgi:hypothetical protein